MEDEKEDLGMSVKLDNQATQSDDFLLGYAIAQIIHASSTLQSLHLLTHTKNAEGNKPVNLDETKMHSVIGLFNQLTEPVFEQAFASVSQPDEIKNALAERKGETLQ